MHFCVVSYKFGTEKEIGEHLGTYHYFIEKMRRLVRAGHQVTVVAPWLSFFRKGSQEIDGVSVIRYWPSLGHSWIWPFNLLVRFFYVWQTRKHVLRTVRQRQADLVYVWQARETGYAVSLIKSKLGVPFYFRQITAWHWHFQRPIAEIFGQRKWYALVKKLVGQKILDSSLTFVVGRKAQLKFAQTIYNQADAVIFLSRAAVDEAQKFGLDPAKAKVLGIAIETDLFQPRDKHQLRLKLQLKGDKIILFIGRINFAEKGLGYLLEAMPVVIKQVPGVILVIVGGGGESRRMAELIDDLGIKKYIQLVGKKSFGELPDYINASDIFVTPSVWLEAFGQVTIEAMSCAIPVVTSDAGASPEINIHGQTGFVVPAKRSAELAEAMITLLSDDELAEKFGRSARQRVLAEYTYEAIIEKFLNLTKG